MDKVQAFTDGACSGNPGKGGFGAILKYGPKELEISEGYRFTTNNRMELLAVIRVLQALKRPVEICITSDSAYVVNAVEKGWVLNWQKKGFKDKANADLWIQYLDVSKKHKVNFKWIKGHAGHHYNERCDRLAVQAYNQDNLKIDEVYERESNFKADA